MKKLFELFNILTPSQKRLIVGVQVAVVVVSLIEVAGVASVAPFLAVALNPSVIEQNQALQFAYQFGGFNSTRNFTISFGIAIAIFIFIGNLISLLTMLAMTFFGLFLGESLASRLYGFYIKQNYLFHTKTNSSLLTTRLAQECSRLTYGVFAPALQLNAKLFIVVVLSLMLIALNPLIAVTMAGVLGVIYLVLYVLVRGVLVKNGRTISLKHQQRYKLMNETFGGIKVLKLTGEEIKYKTNFTKFSKLLARANATTMVIGLAPKYVVEAVVFGGGIIVALFYLLDSGSFDEIIPLLSLYVMAGYKLIPALQQIFSSASLIRSEINAFDVIKEDLLKTVNMEESSVHNAPNTSVQFNNEIRLSDVEFSYDCNQVVVKQVGFSIKKNTMVGFVGSTGSGKTTLVDIIMGLLQPTNGSVSVDGTEITDNTFKSWSRHIGYVPQDIFLLDSSIKSNIAFGIPEEQISNEQLNNAIYLANLENYIAELPAGVETLVGERGVQMSGGQKQRIGIARALYHNPSVLVLDEATSALDGVTESNIMSAISKLASKLTIILIAHRLTTIKDCDCIFLLEKGKILDRGTYEELIEHSEQFRRMADVAPNVGSA